MGVSLRQPVVVANIGGASGSIGAGRLAHAASDGYTFGIGTWSTHVANGAVLSLQYDVVGDFQPIALLTSEPFLIAAANGTPARDLTGLIAWLKGNPGRASMSTLGFGDARHIAGVLFQKQTDTRFVFVPYRGTAQALQDLVTGRIDLTFSAAAGLHPQVRAGAIKAYAVMSASRWAAEPDIPTVDEAGLPGLHLGSWNAFFAPKDTPKSIIAKLNAAVVEALADPAVRRQLDQLGQEIPPPDQQTPEALTALQKAQIAKWWPIINAAGIRAE